MKNLFSGLLLLVLTPFITRGQSIEAIPANFEFKDGAAEFIQEGKDKLLKVTSNEIVRIKDLSFTDGTISFDIKNLPKSFFVSLFFHEQNDMEKETVYLRIPRAVSHLNNNAIQYAPYFDGINLWDIYPQYQAPAPLVIDGWNHMEYIIHGQRLRVFANSKKVLDIPKLEARSRTGSISFDGGSLIKNIKIEHNKVGDLPATEAPDLSDHEANYIREWAATKPMSIPKGHEVTADMLPSSAAYTETIKAERLGLLNLTRKFGRNSEREVVWLKSIITSNKDQNIELELGFSNEYWLFLDNKLTAIDKNLYVENMQKDPGGRLSIRNGKAMLNLHEGRNELTIALANDFYGMGLMARLQHTNDLNTIEAFKPELVKKLENVNAYLGKYENKEFNIMADFTYQNEKLVAKLTAQAPLPLEYLGDDTFYHTREGIQVTFDFENSTAIFKDEDRSYIFNKTK
ncbi:hypothetical protein [Jiulongibacter sp. NS-SX5]|uniref:hypothetical protein n=1 Tax=Jiulongibacter sp. NS-SX5 TaxID=3463854 RepID=UPI004058D49B